MKHLVEVTHAKQQKRVGTRPLRLFILLHHGSDGHADNANSERGKWEGGTSRVGTSRVGTATRPLVAAVPALRRSIAKIRSAGRARHAPLVAGGHVDAEHCAADFSDQLRVGFGQRAEQPAFGRRFHRVEHSNHAGHATIAGRTTRATGRRRFSPCWTSRTTSGLVSLMVAMRQTTESCWRASAWRAPRRLDAAASKTHQRNCLADARRRANPTARRSENRVEIGKARFSPGSARLDVRHWRRESSTMALAPCRPLRQGDPFQW